MPQARQWEAPQCSGFSSAGLSQKSAAFSRCAQAAILQSDLKLGEYIGACCHNPDRWQLPGTRWHCVAAVS